RRARSRRSSCSSRGPTACTYRHPTRRACSTCCVRCPPRHAPSSRRASPTAERISRSGKRSSSRDESPEADRPSVPTLVRRWLFVLNALVLLASLVLGMAGARRGFFLAALVPLALAPFSYARWRLHRTLGGAGWPPRALATLGIACDVVLVVQLVTARTPDVLPALQGPVLAWFGPVWFSAHVLLLAGYGLVGSARIVHRLLCRSLSLVTQARSSAERAPANGPEAIGRRAFLQQMSVAGVAIPFAASASGVSISYDFRVEEREIVLPGWPRELDGLRVAHLSDIHVGGGMTRERLLRVAELTNRCRPDVVAHTGDFLTHRSGDFDAPLYEALGRVRASLGQWACLGNHDYDDPPRLVRCLRDAGVVVLRDHRTRLEAAGHAFEIAGADFMFAHTLRAPTYARLTAAWGARDGTPRILLNHDPSAFDNLPDGTADLVL